jgi:pantothenate kinase-related protein Tda10
MKIKFDTVLAFEYNEHHRAVSLTGATMITVTIQGPQGSGKTRLAKVIEQVVRHKAYQKRIKTPIIIIEDGPKVGITKAALAKRGVELFIQVKQ